MVIWCSFLYCLRIFFHAAKFKSKRPPIFIFHYDWSWCDHFGCWWLVRHYHLTLCWWLFRFRVRNNFFRRIRIDKVRTLIPICEFNLYFWLMTACASYIKTWSINWNCGPLELIVDFVRAVCRLFLLSEFSNNFWSILSRFSFRINCYLL